MTESRTPPPGPDPDNARSGENMLENGPKTGEVASSSGAETAPDTVARQARSVRRGGGLRVLGIALGTLLVLVGIAAGLWAVARSVDTETMAFGPNVGLIVVDDINGSVTFDAGTNSELTVKREWLFSSAPEVDIVERDGTLRIAGDCGTFCRIHISGVAPAAAEIVVKTSAGDINVEGFEAGVDLTTDAGNITVTDVAGPAMLSSDAGWIRARVSDGDVDAQTSAGSINVEIRGDFARVSAISNAGSVRVSVPDGVYRVDAETSAGSTRVNVPTDPDATRVIVARSDAGNVTVDRLPQ